MTATPDGTGAPDGTTASIGARGATGVAIASLVAAASGYAVLVLAATSLTTAENADFLTFWGLVFFLFGTLGGLQSEVTRSVHVARTSHSPSTARHPRVLATALAVGAAGAAAVGLTSPVWADAVLGPDALAGVAVVALGVLAFAGHSAVAGTLAGQGRWTHYARVVGAEALVRLVLAVTVVLAGGGPAGLRVATTAAAATWVLMAAVPTVRRVRHQRTDVPLRPFLTASAHAMVGTASSAALVVGFPVLLRVTTSPRDFALAAPLMLAVQLTRAPLLLPLNAYQGVAITHFLSHRDEGLRPLRRVAVAIVGAGVVGAGAAAAAGPWLMSMLGEDYRVAPVVMAGLTLAAAGMALLTLTGAAVLAVGSHRAYAAGWLAATSTTALLLLLPGGLAARTVASLALGPMVGVAVHLLSLRGAAPAQR